MHRPSDSTEAAAASDPPEPAWDIARLFPEQGFWSEQEYLELNGNRLVEFSHGRIEVLTMPTKSHQLIVAFLHAALAAFATAHDLGQALFAPYRVRLWHGKIREPDIIFVRREHAERMGEEYADGADLLMEMVSDDDRRRDLETKRFEYARAGIPEYWIVDPQAAQITVLRLNVDKYAVHGEFKAGQRATSALLGGFEVDVAAVFAAVSK
jgi:Uma2 family endonuclease